MFKWSKDLSRPITGGIVYAVLATFIVAFMIGAMAGKAGICGGF